ncbi:MAG TPA: FtsQ-type POTRA domain-containing protein [Myxococcaceae bacterium]|nr:FtsQ-type POTRA domain-containing protein [Myxococcaceae bacterium]
MALKKHKNRRRADARQRLASLRRAAGWFARALLWPSLACGSIVALGLGGYQAYRWAHRTPQFALKSVTFQGLRRAQQADLLRLAGVSAGQNLLGLDLQAIERAIAAHPWVDQARVTRRFPDSLAIAVKEHEPAALVALGELYLVDSEGRPFKKIEREDPADLPLITGLAREQFVDAPEQSRLRLRQMLAVAAAYSRSDPPPVASLAEIRMGRSGVVLVTAQGQEIWIGEEDPGGALSRLKKVRTELLSRGLVAQVIHLENRARPGWVAVKLSNGVVDKRVDTDRQRNSLSPGE